MPFVSLPSRKLEVHYEAAGQSVAWFNELSSVRDIVTRLTDETLTALNDMRGLLQRQPEHVGVPQAL